MMIQFKPSRYATRVLFLAVLLVTAFVSGAPIVAQSPQTVSDAPVQPTAVQTQVPPTEIDREFPHVEGRKQIDWNDPEQAQEVALRTLAFMDYQDKLLMKVSILVRNASLQEMVQALGKNGFPIPVEVRTAPFTPITLGVQNVSVQRVLAAVTALTGTELFLLPDHLVITSRQSLTSEEAAIVNDMHNNGYSKNVTALRYSIADEMKRLGKEQVSLSELSPTMQQITQRLADCWQDVTKKPRLKLPLDTQIYCKWEVYHGYNSFTLNAKSALRSSVQVPVFGVRVLE